MKWWILIVTFVIIGKYNANLCNKLRLRKKFTLVFIVYSTFFFSYVRYIVSFVFLYLINPLNLFTFTYRGINMLYLGHMADKKQLPSHNFSTSLLMLVRLFICMTCII